jgi:hypothetical protein
MTWVRWAAAAVILLAVSVTAITVFNNGKKNNEGTVNINPEKINTKSEAPKQRIADNTGKQEATPSSGEKETDKLNDVSDDKQKLAKNDSQQKAPHEKNVKQIKTDLPENKNQVIASNTSDKGSNNLPSPENNPNYNGSTADIKTTVEINQPVYGQKNVNGFTTASLNVTDMRAASYNNTEGRTINPDEEGGDNKKSRGLLRKLTRVFEKNTGIKATTDDDKLHIAAFTVKLK